MRSVQYFLFLCAFLVLTCSLKILSFETPGNPEINARFKTENVFIVVMDGPRYSETWGDSAHRYIPHMAREMAPEGVVFTHFYNNGPTYTNAGHTTLTTGFRQPINNYGRELPEYPSILQYYLKQTGKNKKAAWIITSKDKLEILANTKSPEWHNQYMPSTNCGTNGLRSAYRDDKATLTKALELLKKHHPNVVLINFKEPDDSGHRNDWQGYLQGIRTSDEYIWELWNFIKTDSIYKDHTAFFVTNDHGRHLDGVDSGFSNHGDNCDGCRHINLYAYGPDFKKNTLIGNIYAQQDITATAAYLLHLKMPHSEGKVIKELFAGTMK